ncbi:MAG: Glyoxalase/bleomycin resistance protein/dioxygenase [Glaciihabitans sp.]|jgi:catechol 2,3-dioxygenase-like lactoylglutathione lyase family enzyme|nr:Glyoxalase/bleomycin resistance protein/dioxygenase [Glaciihabitans sp.]
MRIQTVTIPVADQDRALAFYHDVLGFEVRADTAFGDERWLSVAPAGSAVDFTLHPPFPGQAGPGWQQGIVLHTDDIEGVVGALRDAGIEVTEPEPVGWGTQSQFSDPDGNGFVLLQQGPAA